MRKRITSIGDRYEMMFLGFHRNHSEIGRAYFRPSEASKRRFARTIKQMYERGEIEIQRSIDNPHIYRYTIK